MPVVVVVVAGGLFFVVVVVVLRLIFIGIETLLLSHFNQVKPNFAIFLQIEGPIPLIVKPDLSSVNST